MVPCRRVTGSVPELKNFHPLLPIIFIVGSSAYGGKVRLLTKGQRIGAHMTFRPAVARLFTFCYLHRGVRDGGDGASTASRRSGGVAFKRHCPGN